MKFKIEMLSCSTKGLKMILAQIFWKAAQIEQ
jgi:hypothetical protein